MIEHIIDKTFLWSTCYHDFPTKHGAATRYILARVRLFVLSVAVVVMST